MISSTLQKITSNLNVEFIKSASETHLFWYSENTFHKNMIYFNFNDKSSNLTMLITFSSLLIEISFSKSNGPLD